MTLGAMATVRYSPRLAGIYLSDFRRQQRGGGTRNTLIVGAGAWSVDAVLARGMMNHEPAKTNAPTIGGQK